MFAFFSGLFIIVYCLQECVELVTLYYENKAKMYDAST